MISKTCSLCNNHPYARGLCGLHYQQKWKLGEFKNGYRYKNRIVKRNAFAEMEIYDMKGKVKCIAIIDLNDIEKVSKHKWCVTGDGYVMNHKIGKLHTFVTHNIGLVDHINRNRLDCRKSNLRKCNQKQNTYNSSKQHGTKSKYKGIHLNGKCLLWRAQITFNGKRKHLGYYKTEKEAALVYNKHAKVLFGEFANLNIISNISSDQIISLEIEDINKEKIMKVFRLFLSVEDHAKIKGTAFTQGKTMQSFIMAAIMEKLGNTCQSGNSKPIMKMAKSKRDPLRGREIQSSKEDIPYTEGKSRRNYDWKLKDMISENIDINGENFEMIGEED